MTKGLRAKNWNHPAKSKITSKPKEGRIPGKGRRRKRNIKAA